LTFTHPFFTEQFKLWYIKKEGRNIKVIPANIGDLLTPIALAYWLAGEAHYHQRDGVITIATNSFTAVEVDQLRATLLKNLNIESSRNSAGVKDKDQYIIGYQNDRCQPSLVGNISLLQCDTVLGFKGLILSRSWLSSHFD